MGHGVSTAEDTCRHRSGCYRFVRVMNIIDVRYVRNIGYVPDVSYVDDVQINTAVVVPGKKKALAAPGGTNPPSRRQCQCRLRSADLPETPPGPAHKPALRPGVAVSNPKPFRYKST